ncbi:MAG: MTH1187 family thiamine-binding protein [bacterium]|nr:MTH1187 family thiamine-binding protein [bacterium]
MGHVVVEVTVVPLGTGSTSLSSYVAGVEKILKPYKNIKSMLTPMSTILEGELEEILRVIRLMHENPFLNGAQRVSTRISIDDRRDKKITMEGKINAVKEKL